MDRAQIVDRARIEDRIKQEGVEEIVDQSTICGNTVYPELHNTYYPTTNYDLIAGVKKNCHLNNYNNTSYTNN